MTEYIEFIKINAKRKVVNNKSVLDNIKISETESSDNVKEMYIDAYDSYKEIYNAIVARGRSDLEPIAIDGKPIQLDPDNFNSLLIHDYFVSCKVDGERFLMMFSNGFSKKLHIVGKEAKYRNIYFIDTNLNFWYIKQHTSKNTYLLTSEHITLTNIDKCLIDGELVMWGLVEKTFSEQDLIRYTIRNHQQTKAYIAFIAFDMLYGPTNPQFAHEKDPSSTADIFKLDFGSVGAMLGFKGAERWTTADRRYVLERMFNDKYSHIIKYLKELSEKQINFTIMIQPFLDMTTVLNSDQKVSEIEQYTINEFRKILSGQFLRNVGREISNKPLTELLINRERFKKEREKFNIAKNETYDSWFLNEKRTKMFGRGLSTDGLIFTPKHLAYLSGAWTFCSNKQYKWKPRSNLTVDFEIRPSNNLIRPSNDLIRPSNDLIRPSNDSDYYEAFVRNGSKGSKEYIYNGSRVLVKKNSEIISETNESLNKKVIVETNFVEDLKGVGLIFEIKGLRFDKKEPNEIRTVNSIMSVLESKIDILELVKKIKNYSEENLQELMVNSFSKAKLYKMALSATVKRPFTISELYNYRPISNETILGPSSILSKNDREQILNMIRRSLSEPGLELEGQITFKSERNKPITSCLVNNTILSKYKTVPMIRMIANDSSNKRYRTTYINLGSDLIVENVDIKTSLETVEINLNKINDTYDLYPEINPIRTVLSSEENINRSDELDILLEHNETKVYDDETNNLQETVKNSSENDLVNFAKLNGFVLNKSMKNFEKFVALNRNVKYVYQNRYIISNLSLFWSIEIIEQGSSKNSWTEAFDRFNSGTDTGSGETRVELEYQPALYFRELLLLYKETSRADVLNLLVDMLGLDIKDFRGSDWDSYEKLEGIINNIINNLNQIDPIFILEDYMGLIVKILNMLYN